MKTRAVLAVGLFAGAALFCAATASRAADQAAPGAAVIRVTGLATPESALHDEQADVYLVSNINGSPFAKDDNGFISRISPEGKILQLKWIDGAAANVTLNAPKGLALSGDRLYVADIDAVRIFDRKTGAPRGEVAIKGATFLNDVTPAPDGVYVTDSALVAAPSGLAPTGHGALYQVRTDGSVTPLLKMEKVPALNGVTTLGKRILLVPFDSNELLEAKDGKLVTLAKLPKGSLDGIVHLPDGRWAISSWEGQAVYAGPLEGPFETLISGAPSPADIGLDANRHRILIPIFTGDELRIEPIGR